MKRWMAWLLAACMLLLAACNTTPEESSAPSEDTSSEISQGTPELKHTLISVGKPYTSSSQPEERYSDLFGTQLTDGQKSWDAGAHYTDVRMVGYITNTRFDIDLGDDGKKISGMAVRCLDLNKDGVKLASSVRFYGSQDGTTGWETIGRAYFESAGDNTVSTAAVYLDETVDYRYVRASVNLQSGAAFFFIDEIEVYADVEEQEVPNAGETLYNTESVDRGAWAALSTGKTAAPADSTNVAYGASYTFSDCVFDERAPQNDTYLTDGARTGRLYGDDVWVGIKAEGTPSVSLDLGKAYENLYSVRVHMLGSGLHVTYPGAIDVYGSADGKEYTLLGRLYAPAECANYAYTLLLPEYVKARYLRLEFVGGSDWYWVEEIEVMAGYDEEQADELYPELNFPIVTEEELWDPSEEDYTARQNLLLGLPQQIAASKYVATYDPTSEREETAWDAPMLTDGQRAPNMFCYSDGWFFSKGGGALEFFFDLGKLSTVDELNMSYLEQKDWGISRPKWVSVFLSEDGENWYRVDYYERPDNVVYYNDATRLDMNFKLDTAYAARFVRFRVESAVLFVDELEAFGTKEVKADTARLADSGLRHSIYYTNPERAQHANAENTGVKAEEIALIWGGNSGSENMLKGFAAYLDEDGNIADTMMDGFMYFPSYDMPSGSKTYEKSYLQDWEWMASTTFDGTNGLGKLDEVVGEVKEALDLPDYKVQVYFSLLLLNQSVTDFGDVDGDGVSEDCSVSEDRIKIFDWYINNVMTEFANRGYKNLELDGFVWVNEEIGYYVDDTNVLTEAGDCVEKAGTNLLWIPYYTANRYYLGHEMGVDVTSMQPNYMFDLETPLYHLDVTASRTKWMHMAVEIEHSYQAFGDPLYLRNYMLYLYYGAVTGYMDSIHIYYDDTENISKLAYSDDPMQRFQYEATYQFAKGTLDVYPDVRETLQFTTAADTALTATVHTENTFSLYTLAGAPEHGTVSLASDGTFVYYPDKGYKGTDSFTYTYNNYLGESEACTVQIQVG